eukprot:gnl/MRDRNA2_/MRDRNA2_86814_c0_seq7.p1 gnl/MRDRNA2_/MRDRNA2_86814_c0~~gnl/MRDRNA2_/MRDRNA2_86814_c0_seq7.p1  ORF type:complete len:113 (-),score=18.61 gnl/MRDRNA2_/MRDRNA2_86814_c0_seq7:36-374(-)
MDGKTGELSEDTTYVAEGFEMSKGYMASYYQRLFANATKPPVVIQQVFGTKHSGLVARALILENAAYHNAPGTQPFFSQYMREAFYLHTYDWMVNVAEKGNTLFQQAFRRSS